MNTRMRLFLLASALLTTTLLSSARPAASQCVPWMCFIVDEDTTCCYEEDCSLTCWDS